jgi:hypothetical protein
MRPSPSELIAGVRRVLKEEIEPAVTSEHARARLREIRAVLAQLDWDDATVNLADANDALLSALHSVAEWRDADPARARVFSPIALPGVAGRSLAEQQLLADQLAAQAASLAPEFSTWLGGHPHDAEALELRRALLQATLSVPR